MLVGLKKYWTDLNFGTLQAGDQNGKDWNARLS